MEEMEATDVEKNIVKVAIVALRESGKIASFKYEGLSLKSGDLCLVEAERGKDYGRVVTLEKLVEKDNEPPYRILSKATDADREQIKQNIIEAKEAFKICAAKIEEHQKEMRPVLIEYSFDKGKMILYFTSEGRIDFRDLVKDLANNFKARIEMRQIGIRDAAGIVGGIGNCGQVFCCTKYLRDFSTIGVKMAKAQHISLTATKTSGLCGRLMCCLKYEYETYKKLGKNLPKEGSFVETSQGRGTIIDVNVLKQTVRIALETKSLIEVSVDKITILHKELLEQEKEEKNQKDKEIRDKDK